MPVPIKPVNDFQKDSPVGSSGMDYSFLSTFQPPIQKPKLKLEASNKDASILYELWEKGEKTANNTYSIKSADVDDRQMGRLRALGLIKSTGADEIEFTNRGRSVVSTMILAEESKFEERRQSKPYSEILAENSKTGKPGYRTPKFAAHNDNSLDASNL